MRCIDFLVVVIKGARARLEHRLGRVGPHSKPIPCGPCPEHRVMVNSHLGDLKILMAVLMRMSGYLELK